MDTVANTNERMKQHELPVMFTDALPRHHRARVLHAC
jgi:hypothetical protein